jgi:hypothetical protein
MTNPIQFRHLLSVVVYCLFVVVLFLSLSLSLSCSFPHSLSLSCSFPPFVSLLSINKDDDDDDDEFTSDEDDEGDTEEPGANSSETPEVSEADRKAEEERKAKEKEDMLSELGGIEVKSGDYRISIHIIELRDLAPKDANGLADPIVFVEALGDKFNTCVKERTLNAVFNETFIIDKRNVDKEELEQGMPLTLKPLDP